MITRHITLIADVPACNPVLGISSVNTLSANLLLGLSFLFISAPTENNEQ